MLLLGGGSGPPSGWNAPARGGSEPPNCWNARARGGQTDVCKRTPHLGAKSARPGAWTHMWCLMLIGRYAVMHGSWANDMWVQCAALAGRCCAASRRGMQNASNPFWTHPHSTYAMDAPPYDGAWTIPPWGMVVSSGRALCGAATYL